MAGNKFVNGILFGVAKIFSFVFSKKLLQCVTDTTAYRILTIMGFAGYAILIFFPDGDALASVALVLLVTSLGGLQNVFLLICEMCVPPSNIAAVAIMIRTMA